jgi:hypothetical protein
MKPLENPMFEQTALNYFLDIICPKKYEDLYDHFYYKPIIDDKLSSCSHLPEEAFNGFRQQFVSEDERAAVRAMALDRLHIRQDAPYAEDIGEVNAENEAELWDEFILTVFKRLPLNNGHCLVEVQMTGYRMFRYYVMEVDMTRNTVLQHFHTDLNL